MTQWLSMETAPQEGRLVLLLVAEADGSQSHVTARWKDGAWRDQWHMPVQKDLLGWWPNSDGTVPPEPINSE